MPSGGFNVIDPEASINSMGLRRSVQCKTPSASSCNPTFQDSYTVLIPDASSDVVKTAEHSKIRAFYIQLTFAHQDVLVWHFFPCSIQC